MVQHVRYLSDYQYMQLNMCWIASKHYFFSRIRICAIDMLRRIAKRSVAFQVSCQWSRFVYCILISWFSQSGISEIRCRTSIDDTFETLPKTRFFYFVIVYSIKVLFKTSRPKTADLYQLGW